jgi:hypothetical protein
MCLQSLACVQAQGGSGPGSGSGGGSGSGSSSGGAPTTCTPATTVTVTVNGQTYSWNCFTIETANIGSLNQISAIASSGGLKFALVIEGPPSTTFAQGETFPLGSDGGDVVTIVVSGTTPSGDTLGLGGELGNISLKQWSGTNGSQAVVTIGGAATLVGEESGAGGPMQVTATVGGTITAPLDVLP